MWTFQALRYCEWVTSAIPGKLARRIGPRWRAPRSRWRGAMDGQDQASCLSPSNLTSSGPKAMNYRGSGGLVPRVYPH